MWNFLQTAWDKVLGALAIVGGLLAGLYGGELDVSMYVLLGLMVVDFASGLIVAAMGKSPKSETGTLNSNTGLKGIGKKIMILLLVTVAALVDKVLGGGNAAFRTMACWFYIANEGLSVLENSALAGVPWPDGLKKALEQLKTKDKDQE